MENIMTVLLLSLLVEGIVEGIKGGVSKWSYVAMGLAMVLCPLASVDLFALLGIPLGIPYVGAALTGCIVGRGASAVNDLWSKVRPLD